MKSLSRLVLTSLVAAGLLAACGKPAAAPSEDPNAAPFTAVAETQQALELAQATDNAVVTVMPATPTPGPAVDYSTLTEEELAALIDQAVAESITGTERTAAAVATTTSDNVVTPEEVAYVYDYYDYAEYYAEYAEDLMNEYYTLYANLAYEMLNELTAIEAELVQMNDSLTEISSTLDEINSTFSQGLDVAQETVDKLISDGEQAQAHAQAVKTQAQDMMSQLQVDQQGRLDLVSKIQPKDVPTDRLSALRAGFAFIDSAKSAMEDNKVSREELSALAQLGADAQAGFEKFGGAGPAGGPDLSQFTGKFNEITTQIARGQMPQAHGNVDAFEHSLGERPGGGPRKP